MTSDLQDIEIGIRSLCPADRGRPVVVSIVGGVAVGKSTMAETLADLLRPDLRVEIMTTDAFLFSNDVLGERGLSNRKGFPETYDAEATAAFVEALRAGRPVDVPVYSHGTYDIVAGERRRVNLADVVIVEGLHPVDADALVYIDADEDDNRRWFTDRLLQLRAGALDDEAAFFHVLSGFTEDQTRDLAVQIWDGLNGLVLRDHIAPVRDRADYVVQKGPDHQILEVRRASTD